MTKKGHCWEKHERIKDPRSARKSWKYFPINNLAKYIHPILQIIKWILSNWAKENKENEVTREINELVSILVHKQTPCYRIEILKVIKYLVSEEEPHWHKFKMYLKEEKHYFIILKIFNDSYYDVQTYCAQIIKSLALDQSIKDKIFSFMNYSVCPPDQRDIDVSLEFMTAYHSPVFKNQVRNILEHSEEMKSQSSIFRSKKVKSNLNDAVLERLEEEGKFMNELKVGFKDEVMSGSIRSSKLYFIIFRYQKIHRINYKWRSLRWYVHSISGLKATVFQNGRGD